MEIPRRLIYSVIIPVYNTELYLAECIDSVLAQDTVSEYEMILIDDGSTDGSGAICDSYAAAHSQIRVIHTENQGAAEARNIGIRAAEGEYILFLDSDDFWKPDCLSTLDLLVEHRPDMIFFCAEWIFLDGHKEVQRPRYLPNGESGKVWRDRLFSTMELPSDTLWNYGYKRAFIQAHDLYLSSKLLVAHDLEMNIRALDAAAEILGTDRVLYCWRMHSGSLFTSMTPERLLARMMIVVQYFRKYPNAVLASACLAWMRQAPERGSYKEMKPLLSFIKKNEDIFWYGLTDKHARLEQMCCRLFGFYYGEKLFTALRKIKRYMLRSNKGKVSGA